MIQTLRPVIMGVMLAGAVMLMPYHARAAETPRANENTDPTVPTGEGAANNNGTGDLKIMLNFQDAPLKTVLEYLSETAGLTIVSSEPMVDGNITVIRRQPITVDEAVRLINSALKEKDLTTVRTGTTLRVYTLREATVADIPVMTGRDPNAVVPGDNMVTYVIPVGYVTANALRQNLLPLIPEYATLEANQDGNALIITDTTANIRRLMQIIQALDTHMSSVAEIRVFRLINADATSAANLINSIFQQDEATRDRGGGRDRRNRRDDDDNGGSANVRVVAAADNRTNSVVVRGSSEALDIVAGTIEALDDRTTEVADIRVIHLRYADALNTADVINRLFSETGTDTRRGRQQAQGARAIFQRGGQQGDTSTLQVSAAADARTNTVVVTGPEGLLDIVEEVVEGLDTQVADLADVKVFRLEYADAQNAAALINEVFTANAPGGRTTGRTGQNRQVQFGRRGQQAQGTASDAVVVASADTRTNSVVVTGPPETLVTVAEVISDLDQDPKQKRQIFVYPLKNGTAENLTDILNRMFDEMQAFNQQGTGRGGGRQFQGAAATPSAASGEDLSEETYFEADVETNSVLVMTSTTNYEKIRPIIDQLDKPVGQVLIKVLFAEITHSNNVDLGLEFTAWNLRGEDNENIDGELATRFGYPEDGIPGLTASVLDRNLDITVRALQQTGRLNILSRPYILTSNNQTATITVGNEVPFATGSTTVAGQSQVTTEYRDIGIMLSVTPSINPDGLVIMTVEPEISSTTGDSVQVSQELSLPVFATRTSSTKVAVRDGQTIVIGGLIQDEIRDTIRKVPLFGDIPVVGNLFRRTQKENAKTELLIFLTPHVAEDAEALTPISEAERRRSNLGQDPIVADIYQDHLKDMGGPGNADAAVKIGFGEPNEP